jgi:hypothetical protein
MVLYRIYIFQNGCQGTDWLKFHIYYSLNSHSKMNCCIVGMFLKFPCRDISVEWEMLLNRLATNQKSSR